MTRRTALVSVAGLVLAGLAAAPVAVPAAPARAADPVRILIIGDSMTQGSSGDWTWRYRLSKHLTDHGASFDLVGHRDDLYDNVAGVWGSHAYVDPAFDQAHSARWGMRLADLEVSIGTLVSTYHPDVVLAMLGDNDLSAGTTPTQVGALLEDFVDDARAAQPGIDVILGHDPRPHTQPNAPALNAEIDARAAALDTPSERVVVAMTDAGYDDLQDTWDGAHPNARGELKIAAAFENALHEVNGAFPVADPIPTVPLGPRIPPVLTATPQLRAVRLDWVRSPGSQKSEIWQRDLTAGEAWHRVPPDSSALTSTVTGLTDGHQVQFQTRPWKGFWIAQADAWSNVVQVQVLGDHLDRPVPSATATAGGVATVAWAPVTGAASYAVQWRRADRPGGWLGSVTSTGASATLDGLTNRVRYAFRVRAESGALTGDWSVEATVLVPSLAAVTGARLRRAHGGQLKATARDVALATSYTLLAAPAASCAHPPRSRAFRVVAVGLSRPAKRFRLDARAVWARWVAVRGGVEGDLGPSSTDCLRLR